jgi:hypothetical protein
MQLKSIGIGLLLASRIAIAAEQNKPAPVIISPTSTALIGTDRGTAENPIVVTGRAKTQEEKDIENKKQEDDHNLASATRTLAMWTVVLGAASIFTAIISIVAIRLSKKAADVLPKLERAYIFASVQHQGFATDSRGRYLIATITWTNHGKTPAILKSLEWTSKIAVVPPDVLKDYLTVTREMPEGMVIGAQSDLSRTHHHYLTEDEFKNLQYDTKNVLHVYGSMAYYDVISEYHLSMFSWKFVHEQGFEIAPLGKNRWT